MIHQPKPSPYPVPPYPVPFSFCLWRWSITTVHTVPIQQFSPANEIYLYRLQCIQSIFYICTAHYTNCHPSSLLVYAVLRTCSAGNIWLIRENYLALVSRVFTFKEASSSTFKTTTLSSYPHNTSRLCFSIKLNLRSNSLSLSPSIVSLTAFIPSLIKAIASIQRKSSSQGTRLGKGMSRRRSSFSLEMAQSIVLCSKASHILSVVGVSPERFKTNLELRTISAPLIRLLVSVRG